MRRKPTRRRATCATCGQENVCHDLIGEPYARHRRGKRHRAAVEAAETKWIAEYRAKGASFPVTDPDLDAPDGAIVEGYRRVGNRWERTETR